MKYKWQRVLSHFNNIIFYNTCYQITVVLVFITRHVKIFVHLLWTSPSSHRLIFSAYPQIRSLFSCFFQCKVPSHSVRLTLSLFCDVTLCRLAVLYRIFRTPYSSHLQGSTTNLRCVTYQKSEGPFIKLLQSTRQIDRSDRHKIARSSFWFVSRVAQLV